MLKLTEEDLNKIILFCDEFEEAIVCRNLNGDITYFSKGAERLYGYTAEEVIGKSISIFHTLKNENELNSIENFETIRRNKDGDFIDVLLTVYLTYKGDEVIGSASVSKDAIAKDIFKLAVEGGNFGVWDWEIATNKVYYSNRWKEMLGYKVNEISDTYGEWINRIHQDDLNYVIDKVKSHFKGEEYIVQYRLKCKDDNYKWIRTRGKVIKWDKEGNPLRMTGTNEDINKDIILKKENEEKENRLIGIYNSMNAGMAHGEIIFDSFGKPIDVKLLHINNYMRKILGIGEEDSVESNVPHFTLENKKKWFALFCDASLKSKTFNFEDYNEKTDEYYKVNIYSPNPKQFAILITDITENKKKEIALRDKYEELQAVYEELTATEEELRNNYKELEKINEKAENSNKAKSEFLSNMSHELRTPLNGILGCTQLLKLSKLDKEQNEDILTIEKSSDHLLKLINDILDLSKIESGKIQLNHKIFNFKEEMDSVIKDLNLLSLGKNIEIMYYIDPFISKELIGDSFRLKQILNNLISNAVKFTDHGHIYFKVKQISKTEDKTKLQFVVADTGRGIHEDLKADIFDKFTQGESTYTKRYGGTGLGLSIAKNLAQMMGGDIICESEVDKGSVFYFTAVFENNLNEECCVCENIVSYKLEKGEDKTVLVVEDNDINLKIVTSFLEKLNYKFVPTQNGKDAIKYLENNKVDLILMDIQMPVLNGYDATKIIREKESNTGEHKIIIAMTAYAMEGDRKKFIDCGMDDYISKPFEIEALGEILKKY